MFDKFCLKRIVLAAIIFGFCQPLVTSLASADKSEFSIAVDFVKEKKYVEAYRLFLKLSELNDHDAQFNAALLLKKGLGHPTNYKLALKWVSLAELGGLHRAADLRQEVLALLPDETASEVNSEIEEILRTRLESGEVDVCLQLAQFHLDFVNEPDYKKAYALRSVASALNVPGALRLRDKIEDELEAADLIEAQSSSAKMFNEIKWELEVDY